MKFLLDMNISPLWVHVLEAAGWTAFHWSTIGDPGATDVEILKWAVDNKAILFTHDLDFGTLLAATNAEKPSVIQVRSQSLLSTQIGDLLVTEIRAHEQALAEGVLMVVDRARLRIRILPLGKKYP